MVGGQQGFKPAGTGAAVVVHVDRDAPFILLCSLAKLRAIELQGLRQVPEMEHNRQSLAGQGSFDFCYVDMRGRYVRDSIGYSITRPDRLHRAAWVGLLRAYRG